MKEFMDNGMSFDDAYDAAHLQAAKEYNVSPDGKAFYTDEAN